MHDIDAFHREIGRLFRERDLPAWSVNIPIGTVLEWAAQIEESSLAESGRAAEACREACRILAEAQLMLGHCLVVHDRGKLLPGGRLFVEQTERIQIGLDEWYFWTYLNFLWEAIYRSWERQTRFLQAMFLPLTLTERTRLYFPDVVARISAGCPRVAGLPAFQRVVDQIPNRKMVADKRNELSHRASSLFARVDADFAGTGILSARGVPMVVHSNLLPDAGTELDDSTARYVETGRNLLVLRELFAECLEAGVFE